MFLHKNKRDGLTGREKRILWSRIRKEIAQEAGVPVPFGLPQLSPFRSTYKFALASLLVVALTASSAATVSAADNAVPGDALFPLDIAIEKIQIVFSKGNRTDTLRIHFAEERLLEVKATVAQVAHVVQKDDTEVAEATEATEATGAAEEAEKEDILETKQLARAEKALLVARNHLEKGRSELQKGGNTSAALIIDDIIAELDGLADIHVQKGRGRGRSRGKSALAPGQIKKISAVITVVTEDGSEDSEEDENNENSDEDGDEDENDKNDDENAEENNENEDNDAEDEEEDNENDDNDDGEDTNETKNGRGHGSKKVTLCHIPTGNVAAAHTIVVGSPAARAHIIHGDTLGACGEADEDENDEEEDEEEENDTIAPTLSNISAASATTSADITWTTNEQATSKVWYQITSPVIINSAPVSGSDTLSENHTITLSSLTASTTYFYIVSSTDEAGNSATSSELSFTTFAETPSDETAPVISGVAANDVASTTATILWTTDESATGTLWYDTTTPLVISSSTPFTSNTSLVQNHSHTLSGLSASTTYYYIVSSSDEAGNSATTTEFSFTTTD